MMVNQGGVMTLRQPSTVIIDNDFPITDVMAPHPTAITPIVTQDAGRDVVEVDEERGVTLVATTPAGLMGGAILALLLSAWAGIVPLVGPTFGFAADGRSSWTW